MSQKLSQFYSFWTNLSKINPNLRKDFSLLPTFQTITKIYAMLQKVSKFYQTSPMFRDTTKISSCLKVFPTYRKFFQKVEKIIKFNELVQKSEASTNFEQHFWMLTEL